MKSNITERTVLVPLPVTFIDALLKMLGAMDNDLVSALETGRGSCSASHVKGAPEEMLAARKQPHGRYTAEFLGVVITARTLPGVFAIIVDMTAEVAPEALDRLSMDSARTRRFVARKPEMIHPGREDLSVMQTVSGWWISKNIGQEDLKRALRALSRAAGLRFGSEVKFPSRHKAE